MRRKRARRSLAILASVVAATFRASLAAPGVEPEYTIETIAGNGQSGDLPGEGGRRSRRPDRRSGWRPARRAPTSPRGEPSRIATGTKDTPAHPSREAPQGLFRRAADRPPPRSTSPTRCGSIRMATAFRPRCKTTCCGASMRRAPDFDRRDGTAGETGPAAKARFATAQPARRRRRQYLRFHRQPSRAEDRLEDRPHHVARRQRKVGLPEDAARPRAAIHDAPGPKRPRCRDRLLGSVRVAARRPERQDLPGGRHGKARTHRRRWGSATGDVRRAARCVADFRGRPVRCRGREQRDPGVRHRSGHHSHDRGGWTEARPLYRRRRAALRSDLAASRRAQMKLGR